MASEGPPDDPCVTKAWFCAFNAAAPHQHQCTLPRTSMSHCCRSLLSTHTRHISSWRHVAVKHRWYHTRANDDTCCDNDDTDANLRSTHHQHARTQKNLLGHLSAPRIPRVPATPGWWNQKDHTVHCFCGAWHRANSETTEHRSLASVSAHNPTSLAKRTFICSPPLPPLLHHATSPRVAARPGPPSVCGSSHACHRFDVSCFCAPYLR
jgi:hypothetical protein